ncbi:hypothetical protein [Streptomyces sp. NPDC059063]|uniref:hypothetical protein n=1 Tax=unclassified Streptomyces TaxID=2593676 RepID=UPI00369699D4
MPEGDSGATTPYTDAARARVVLAHEACALAELARAAVPIGAHELNPDGTLRSPGAALADAAGIVAAAHHLLEAAVVVERLGGASWQLVGDTLGVAERTARDRYAQAEARFRENLLAPEPLVPEPLVPEALVPEALVPDVLAPTAADREMSWWRAHTAREPLEAALDLDDWVRRHTDGDSHLGAKPVSGGLVRKDSRRATD